MYGAQANLRIPIPVEELANTKPLATWVVNDPDGLWRKFLDETSAWAREHMPEHSRRAYRVDFFLIDIAFIVVYRYLEAPDGGFYFDLLHNGPVRAEPYIAPISQLPPKHLMGM